MSIGRHIVAWLKASLAEVPLSASVAAQPEARARKATARSYLRGSLSADDPTDRIVLLAAARHIQGFDSEACQLLTAHLEQQLPTAARLRALGQLAFSAEAAGRYQDALRAVLAARALPDGDNATTLVQEASIRVHLGDHDAAEALLRGGLFHSSPNAQNDHIGAYLILSCLAPLLASQQRQTEAYTLINEAEARYPEARALWESARSFATEAGPTDTPGAA